MDEIASIMSDPKIAVATFDMSTLQSLSAANNEPPSISGGKKNFNDDDSDNEINAIDDLFADFDVDDILALNNDRLQDNTNGTFGTISTNVDDKLVANDIVDEYFGTNQLNYDIDEYDDAESPEGSYSNDYTGEHDIVAEKVRQRLEDFEDVEEDLKNEPSPDMVHSSGDTVHADDNNYDLLFDYNSDNDDSDEQFNVGNNINTKLTDITEKDNGNADYVVGNGSRLTNIQARMYNHSTIPRNNDNYAISDAESEDLNLDDYDMYATTSGSRNVIYNGHNNTNTNLKNNVTNEQYLAYKKYVTAMRPYPIYGRGMANEFLSTLLATELNLDDTKNGNELQKNYVQLEIDELT